MFAVVREISGCRELRTQVTEGGLQRTTGGERNGRRRIRFLRDDPALGVLKPKPEEVFDRDLVTNDCSYFTKFNFGDRIYHAGGVEDLVLVT